MEKKRKTIMEIKANDAVLENEMNFFFWLGEDGEIESLKADEFNQRQKEYEYQKQLFISRRSVDG